MEINIFKSLLYKLLEKGLECYDYKEFMETVPPSFSNLFSNELEIMRNKIFLPNYTPMTRDEFEAMQLKYNSLYTETDEENDTINDEYKILIINNDDPFCYNFKLEYIVYISYDTYIHMVKYRNNYFKQYILHLINSLNKN